MEETRSEATKNRRGGSRVQQPEKKRRRRSRRHPGRVLAVVLVLVLAGYCGLCAYAGSRNKFAPNRQINGIDVGGLTVEAAQEKLETTLLGQEITLKDPDSDAEAVITVADLGYTADSFAGDAQYWMDNDHSLSFFRKGWAYLAYATGRWPGGASWPDMDTAALDATVSKLAQQLAEAPVDSTYEVKTDAIAITKGRDGRALDTEALRSALEKISDYSQEGYTVPLTFTVTPAQVLTAQAIHDEAASEMKNAGYDAATRSIIPEQLGADFDISAAQKSLDDAQPGDTVEVPATIETPKVTAAELKKVLFRDVLGECQTQVKGTSARRSNVKLSASSINGYVLNTGDVFSYNGVVGQRTAARGYQAAPAYVKGETVDEIGGGICQTSSTLYLACLRGNLKITERYAHRYVPSYVPAGMDATVSWGGPDYKFTNDTDYPIKIVASYANGYLTVKVLGTNVTGITAKMTNEKISTTDFQVVYEDDSSLAPGTEKVKTTPYTGSKWKTYRNLYDASGKLIATNFEATSDYKVRNKVILRGPAKTSDSGESGSTTKPADNTKPAEPSTPATDPPQTEPPAVVEDAPEG